MVSAYVNGGVHTDIFLGDMPIGYYVMQARECDAQARTKGLSNEAEPQPQPESKTERKPKPTDEPEPEPAPPEPQPSPPVPAKSNPPSKTGPIIETTFEEHLSNDQPPPEPPKDDLAKAAASAFGLATFFYKKAFELQTISTGISNSAQTPDGTTPATAPVIRDLTPTNIDELELIEGKVKHIIEGSETHDHLWEKLVPDKNWPDIKSIIKDVIETGETGYSSPQYNVKIKTIGDYRIEVRYNVGKNNIRKISNAFIQNTHQRLTNPMGGSCKIKQGA